VAVGRPCDRRLAALAPYHRLALHLVPAPRLEAPREVHVIACDDILHRVEYALDEGYRTAAGYFIDNAAIVLRPFNLRRHTLVVTEHGLKVRSIRARITPDGTFRGVNARHYWEIRGSEAAVIQAIYAVGQALEKLPQPVLDKLVGVTF